MAKIISWKIGDKFAYIKKVDGSYVQNSQVSDSRINDLFDDVRGWDENTYYNAYKNMYSAVMSEIGYSDLISPLPESENKQKVLTAYFRPAQFEGVYLLTGKDGDNIADAGLPYYTIVMENTNTSLGLGGDEKLDVEARMQTTIYLVDKFGHKHYTYEIDSITCPGISIDDYSSTPGTGGAVWFVIPADTPFAGSDKTREFTITVKKGDWTGSVVFSVVGVKDGAEGVSYDLLVSPKQIKIQTENDLTLTTECRVLLNGVALDAAGLTRNKLSVKKKFGEPTTDVEDVTGQYYSYTLGDTVTAQEIARNGNEVTFYLLHEDSSNVYSLIDSDSCTVVTDGKDGGGVFLELTNEIDGISVGNDDILDIGANESVTSMTYFTLYSGSTPMDLTEVSFDGFTNSSTGTAEIDIVDGDGKRGYFKITLKNGFKFGEDLREVITLHAKGTIGSSTLEGEASKNYTILAIPGGKDGEVFRLLPNYDEINCDPNDDGSSYAGENLTVDAYIGLERITDSSKWESTSRYTFTYAGREYYVGYTKDITYNGNNTGNTTPYYDFNGTNPEIVISDEIVRKTKYIAFYLFVKVAEYWYLVDRESIPFLYQGKDGSAVWVELGNEVDAVSVGEDSDLDLIGDLTSVTLTTDVRLFSSGTLVEIDDVQSGLPIESETAWQYSQNAGKYKFSREPYGGTDKSRWIISVTLYDGFEFGPDYRERIQIKVVAGRDTGNPYTGYTYYTITGVKGGKDGYVYRLVPEADYIHYHTNLPIEDNRLDEHTLMCDAYYGNDKLNPADENPWGKIYYSVNMRCESIDDTATGDYATGMTEYQTGGVNVDALGINISNYKSFKYIVFYLTIPDDEGGEIIIDRETVPFIADGVDAHDNLFIELGNEIDSIGTGPDTKLDIVDPATASTTVRLISGATELEIFNISASGFKDPNPNHYSWTTKNVSDGTATSSSNPSKLVEFFVYLNNGFEFGKDTKEKVILTVSGYAPDGSNRVVTAATTFVLAAIVGGAEGVSYKVQPTPDMLLYDFETGNWAGGITSVSAKAYANGILMSEQGYIQYGNTNANYWLKIGTVVWDLETATNRWNESEGTLDTYYEGNGVPFATPDTSGREQMKVFYLAVKFDGSDKWTVVDRETVSLHVSGKNGKDGVSSPSFDLTNPIEVIATGDNDVLNLESASATRTYTTTVKGKMGSSPAPINVTTEPHPYGNLCTATTANNGSNEVTINVKLKDGFSFAKTSSLPEQKRTFSITASFVSDPSITETLTFTLKSIRIPDVPEGESYKLKTTIPSMVFDGEEYSPRLFDAALCLGSTKVAACLYAIYTGTPLTLEQAMTRSTYSSRRATSSDRWTFKAYAIEDGTLIKDIPDSISENGYVYVGAFSDNDEFYDYDDIPINYTPEAGGGSSGIIADLTDDVGVVATGENKRLEANTELVTTATVRNGFDPLVITGMKIAFNNTEHDFPYEYTDANGGKIRFTKGSLNERYVDITATITADDSHYIDFGDANPIQFKIIMTADTLNESVYVSTGYSILGLQGGKDGNKFKLVLNADQVFYDANKPEGARFSPSAVTAQIYLEDENLTGENGVSFEIKNSDADDPTGTELWWLDAGVYDSTNNQYVFALSENEYSEYEPLTIRAKSGNTIMDWETVQVLRDGKDGVGGVELILDHSPFEIEQIDGDKIVLEDVSAMTYVSLHSGSTVLDISEIDWIPSQSTYGSGIGFETGVTDGDCWLLVNIPQGYNFSNYPQTQIRVTATGGTAPNEISRKATFVITEKTGGKGDRGPKTRIRDWSAGADYMNGSEGDEFWDIVYYSCPQYSGFFGCKTDHTNATDAQKPLAPVNGDTNPDDNYWIYYPNYDFTATKVLSVGEGSNNGWVIDKGKIQHTNSSITLTSDGEITVSVPTVKYAAYKNGNTTYYIDAGAGHKIGDRVTAYEFNSSEGDIQLDNGAGYLKEVTNVELYYEGTEYLSSFEEATNVACYIDCEKDLKKALSTVDENDNPRTPDPIVYSTKAISSIYYAIIQIEGDLTRYVYKFEANSTVGAYDASKSGPAPVVLGRINDNPEEGGGGVVPKEDVIDTDDEEEIDPYDYPDDTGGGDTPSQFVPDSQAIIEPVKIVKFGVNTNGGINNSDIKPNITIEGANGANVYTNRRYISLFYNFDTSVTFGSPADVTETKYNRSLNDDKDIDRNKVSLKIQSVDYENISDTPILTVGYPEDDYIFEWKSTTGNETIYTKINVPSECVYDSYGVLLNSCYPNGDYIVYQGISYAYNRRVKLSTVSSGQFNKDRFAFTKIYGDGRVVTDKLIAVGGEFTGNIVATNGTFNGTVNATNGVLTNVTVNGQVNGNVKMAGGNTLSMVDATGIERVNISNEVYSPSKFIGGSNYVDFSASENIFHEWENSGVMWVAKDYQMPSGKTVFDAILYEGDKLSGEIAITFTFKNCHESATSPKFWILFDLLKGNGMTYTSNLVTDYVLNGSHTIYLHIGNVSADTSKNGNNSITADSTSSTDKPGRYRLIVRAGGTFRKNVWGHTATFDISLNTNVKLTRTGSESGKVNRLVIGANGFAHMTREGGLLSSVANDNGTSTMAFYSNQSSNGKPNMGIFIDDDEFRLYFNGNKYKITSYNNQLQFVLDSSS